MPESLTVLELSYRFNNYINVTVFPEKLTKLVFGCDFNTLIDKHVLPESLLELVFGTKFDKPLMTETTSVLPNNLTSIKFGNMFYQPIFANIISKTLKILDCNDCFHPPIIIGELQSDLILFTKKV